MIKIINIPIPPTCFIILFYHQGKDCIKLGKYLLSAGADAKNGYALNLALKRNPKADLKDEWKAFILKLISNGANTNAGYDSSSTPSLILAIHSEDTDIVKALLEHGADSNVSDYTGTTLIHACRLSKIPVFYFCLKFLVPSPFPVKSLDFVGAQCLCLIWVPLSNKFQTTMKCTIYENVSIYRNRTLKSVQFTTTGPHEFN